MHDRSTSKHAIDMLYAVLTVATVCGLWPCLPKATAEPFGDCFEASNRCELEIRRPIFEAFVRDEVTISNDFVCDDSGCTIVDWTPVAKESDVTERLYKALFLEADLSTCEADLQRCLDLDEWLALMGEDGTTVGCLVGPGGVFCHSLNYEPPTCDHHVPNRCFFADLNHDHSVNLLDVAEYLVRESRSPKDPPPLRSLRPECIDGMDPDVWCDTHAHTWTCESLEPKQ